MEKGEMEQGEGELDSSHKEGKVNDSALHFFF